MTKAKKGKFALHCIMCGKDFHAGDKAECGGIVNGKPWCKADKIQREMDARLPPAKPANAV